MTVGQMVGQMVGQTAAQTVALKDLEWADRLVALMAASKAGYSVRSMVVETVDLLAVWKVDELVDMMADL